MSGCSHLKQPERNIRRSKSRDKNINTHRVLQQESQCGHPKSTPKRTGEELNQTSAAKTARIFLVDSLSCGSCKADVSRAAYLHWCRRQRLQCAGRQQNCMGRRNRSVVGPEDHKRVGWYLFFQSNRTQWTQTVVLVNSDHHIPSEF